MSDTATLAPAEFTSVELSRRLDAIWAAWKAGVFTEDEREARSAPLRELLHQAAADEYAAVVAALGGDVSLLAVGTWVVVAGELIESAWGNQVRADLLSHESAIGRITADSGWVSMTIVTGFTGSVLYRRVGSLVSVVISITRGGANLGNVTTTIATIPEAAARPSATVPGVVFATNPAAAARFNVTPAGAITLIGYSVNDTGIIQGSASFAVALP